MNICYLIGAMPPTSSYRFTAAPGDLVIAADAGWQRAEAFGLTPHLAVGDFDTAPPPAEIPTVSHPARKDDTDLMLAARIGAERGYKTFVLLGASGGRPDHTYAAYQTLAWLTQRGRHAYLVENGMTATLLQRERMTLCAPVGTTFSLFAYGGSADGVTIRGASYPLEEAALTPDFPIGVSNRFADEPVSISLTTGSLLCFVEGMPSLIPAMEEGRAPLLPLSGAILDMDGTLIDSNPHWDRVGERYLERHSLTPTPDFWETIQTMPVPFIGEFIARTYNLSDTPEEVAAEIFGMMDGYYRDEAMPKRDALALIRRLEDAGVPYCIATASDSRHAKAGLAHLGITGYRFILTCDEVGEGKSSPAVFEEALRRLGSLRATTAVFEDSPKAIKTAHRAGFLTVSIYDNTFADAEEEKRRIADYAVNDFAELPEICLAK